MTDLELFKSIVRAITGVPASDVSKAVAKVRALLGQAAPSVSAELSAERKSRGTRDRMYVGGTDRSGNDAA